MSLPLEQVQHIANLARLELTDEELSRYRQQLSEILAYFQQLQAIDTQEIPPTTSGFNLDRTLRPDLSSPGLELQDLLQNAAEVEKNQFRVPPVFE
ncbi:MAG: Asp-tRNA(Asn)/Glu-tRNA(Gln) amidotransferase subunit GatC [Anaerolineales bacterium]|nr:Asp-tRNA(Asn)/Glu-tRNA(Gln) amidotransferase subunit GatC [Anaerolineales bacterium]